MRRRSRVTLPPRAKSSKPKTRNDSLVSLKSPKIKKVKNKKSFEVESILKHRELNGIYEYKVKWKGYKKATWAPEKNFSFGNLVLKNYKQANSLNGEIKKNGVKKSVDTSQKQEVKKTVLKKILGSRKEETESIFEDSTDDESIKKMKNKVKVKTKRVKHSKGKDRVKMDLNEARNRLHASTIPRLLPCRDQEFADIYDFVKGHLKDGSGGCMYISGVPGTGKTATVCEIKRKLLEERKKLPKFDFVEINGLQLSEPFQCYTQILLQLIEEKHSSRRAVEILEKRFGSIAKHHTIIIVDELDLLKTRKQNILYNLFDWPSRVNSKLIVLAIANAMDLPERVMMNRITSRIGLNRLTFQPYSYEELNRILLARLENSQIFNENAVQLIARKVAAVSGDARRALDIARRAAEEAQMENAELVDINHVDKALKDIYSSIKIIAISNASDQEKIFLQAVTQDFRISGLEEATFLSVYRHHVQICSVESEPIPTTSQLFEVAQNLASLGLILMEQSRLDIYRRIRLNVSVDDINFALKEV